MTPLDTCSLALFTVMLACGQVFFKRVGLTLQGHSGVEAIRLVMREPSLYLALVLYAGATLLWIWILSRITLSQAYPWVAVGMVIVPMLGWLVFGERVAPAFWLGVAFIIIGVGLTQYAALPDSSSTANARENSGTLRSARSRETLLRPKSSFVAEIQVKTGAAGWASADGIVTLSELGDRGSRAHQIPRISGRDSC